MLFTTINDDPSHHNLSGQSKRKGAACPHFFGRYLRSMAKTFKEICIYGAPSFPQQETFIRTMDCQLNGEKENREAPLHVTRDMVHLKVMDVKTIEELSKLTEKTLGKRKKRDGEEEEEEGMWNKKSILWELEYWPMLDVHHWINNMHVENNVCEATCGTLLQQKSKGKYHKNAREDLKELGIKPELYAKETETRTNRPFAATPLSMAERKEFCQFLHDLKVPSGYS
jgi:hypothetical protein